MNNIIYSRISENRDNRFLLSTTILEKGGVKVVQKKAATKSAINHMNTIYKNYSILSKQYDTSNINIIPCTRMEDALEFEFCTGVSLDTLLDEKLERGNISEFIEMIENYFHAMKEYSCKSDNDQVDCDIFSSMKSHKFDDGFLNLNIDAIFSNVFLTDNSYTMIDYEWVMDKPISFKYFIYRCLFWYINDKKDRVNYLKLDLFHYFGFNKKEIEIFARMEDDFQNYVRGKKIPMWKLEESINQNKRPLNNFIDYEKKISEKSAMKAYFDYGSGFSEENTLVVQSNLFNDKSTLKIKIPTNCIKLRIDPVEYSSILTVYNAFKVCYHAELREIIFDENSSNGCLFDHDQFVFYTDDPQLYLNIEPDERELVMELSINELTNENAQNLFLLGKENQNAKRKLQENINLIQEQKLYIDKLNVLCREKDKYAKKIEDMCREKESYVNNLESLIREKALCVNDLESLNKESEHKIQSLSNDVALKQNHINNIEAELNAIKTSLWFRIIMKIKRILGRG